MPENVNTSALVIDGASQGDTSDNRETMIKIDHVSMVFNMASEQLNNLKEYAIKLAKRELFFEGFKALDDISFEVKKGDVFGIMGTNGSGKSTLLKIVAGVLEPSEGTCEINGSIAPLIELGAGFDMDLTARENIYLNGALLGYSKKFIDEHFDEIVEFAEVEKFLDMPLKNYSSGMVARIAFAIATVIVPEILIVDEVLSVGDFMFQKKCEDRINQLIEEYGVTVLIVSHSNEQIARLCNKAIWIEKGHTRLLGDVEEVCRVYDGLGGRTGSLEAEQRVFKALEKSLKKDTSKVRKTISGENANGTSVKLMRDSWKGRAFSSVVLVCDNTHVNSVVANAFASAINAPIFSTKIDNLVDSVESVFYESKPEEVVVFDCGGHAEGLIKALNALPWRPRVLHFGKGKELLDFSLQVFDYGKKQGYWNECASLIAFSDNPEALAASPYLYKRQCPAIMFLSNELSPTMAERIFFEKGITSLIAFGKEAASLIGSSLYTGTVEVFGAEKEKNPCRDIAEFVYSEMTNNVDSDKQELCMASMSSAQWPEALSCGVFAGKKNSALLLSNSANLDSIAELLDFIKQKKNKISKIIFIGSDSGISLSEQELYATELLD